MPDIDWTCCDIHPAAVSFIKNVYGLDAFVSTHNPTEWLPARTFDVVFALSFFSHMPAASFGPWLSALAGALNPGGLLIFTSHGEQTARLRPGSVVFDERGFNWVTHSDQGDLDPETYGTSIAKFSFINQTLVALPLRLIRFQEAFWWGHQDLYIAKRVN